MEAAKAALREQARAQRSALDADDRSHVAMAVAAHFFEQIRLAPETVVAGYWSIGDEIDCRPIMLRLIESGHKVCLPAVEGEDRPLRLRLWEDGAPLFPSGFGTLAPSELAPEVAPQLVLMPLLGFDAHGTRLGYGGGYYDRTLAPSFRPAAPNRTGVFRPGAAVHPAGAARRAARCRRHRSRPAPFRAADAMRVLFLGDVVGRAGRDGVAAMLPGLIDRCRFDLVVVNGENASHGRGLTEPHFRGLREAGADAVTLGDHAFDQRDTLTYIEREPTLLRPLNFAPGTPGRGGDAGGRSERASRAGDQRPGAGCS